MSCETYAKTDSHPHMTYSKFLALQTHCCWWNDVMMTPAAGEVISQIVIASFVVCIKGLEQKRLNYGAGCIALHGPASIMSPAPESESGEQQQRSVKYQLGGFQG